MLSIDYNAFGCQFFHSLCQLDLCDFRIVPAVKTGAHFGFCIPDLGANAIRIQLSLHDFTIVGAGCERGGCAIDVNSHIAFQCNKVARSIGIDQRSILQIFTNRLSFISATVQRHQQSATEMQVAHSSLGPCSIFHCLSRNCLGSIIEVAESSTVDIEEAHECGSIRLGYIRGFIKQTILLGLFQRRAGQTAAGEDTGLEVVVGLQSIGTIIEVPVHSMDIDVILVPVVFIGLENNGVFLGRIGYKVRTIVGNVIRILTIEIGLSFRIVVRSELTALGGIVVTAHRSKDTITQHGGKEEARSCKGVFQSMVVQSLYANGGEVSGFTIHVCFSTGDVAAFRTYQVFKTFCSIHHVLHTGYPVVSLDVCNLTALAVDPHCTLADGEGIGQAVFGNGVSGSQSRLLNIFFIILIQTIIGVDDCTGVSLFGGSQHVPGIRVAGICIIINISQFITLFGQVSLGLGVIFAGAMNFIPQSTEFFDFFGLQHAVLDNDKLMNTVCIVAPECGIAGTRCNAGNGILTASALQRNHDARAQKLCLGDCHEGIPFRDIFSFLGCQVFLVEFAQNCIIDFGGCSFISFHIHFRLCFSCELCTFAQCHTAKHGQSKNQ